jgi:ATP-dependent helicase/nuclease subunit B
LSTVQFILGRAGTGKTTRLTDMLRDLAVADPLGKPVLLVVPDQATLMYERLLACEVLPQGNTRVRVVSFTLLGRDILSRHGQLPLPELTPLGRRLLLFRSLLRTSPQLQLLTQPHVGMVEPLSMLLRELEKADRTGDDLQFLAADLKDDHPQLAAKLSDLSAIDKDYRTAIADRLDPARREQLVLNAISQSEVIRDSHLFLDDFDRFSPIEKRWLTAISKRCASITLAISSVHSDFVDQTRTLFSHCTIRPDITLDKPLRFASPDLTAIEYSLATHSANVRQRLDSPGVRLMELPDPTSMAVAVAREIALLISGGFRYRDIVVLTRDTTHHAALQSAMVERSIPHFLDARRPATAHPLVRSTLALLQWCTAAAPVEAAVNLLKLQLIDGVSSELAEQFEQFTLQHRLTGHDLLQGPFQFEQADLDSDAADDQSQLLEPVRKKLVDATQPLRELFNSGSDSTQTWVTTIYSTFVRFNTPQVLARDIDAAKAALQFDLAQAHEQVWSQWTGTLDTLVELLGSDAVSPDQARLLVEESLADLDLAIVPPTLDQVLLGTAERTRTHPATRVAFIVGLNDGEFPARAKPDVLLSDLDRTELLRRGVEVDAPSTDHDTEFHLAYHAMTRARDRLYLLRSHTDHNRAKRSPGRFFKTGLDVVGILKDPPKPTIDTPQALAAHLLAWANSNAPLRDTSAIQLYHSVISSTDSILLPVRNALRAVDYRNEAALSPELAGRLVVDGAALTARQLETFAKCPFQHFIRYGLGIRPSLRRSRGIDDRMLKRAHHKAAMELTRMQIENKAGPSFDFTQSQIDRAVERAVFDLSQRVVLTPRRRRRIQTSIRPVLLEFARFQKLIADVDKGKPVASDVFAADQEPLTIVTKKNRRVTISLPLDRVDIVPSHADGNTPLLRVVSLRTGNATAIKSALQHIGAMIEMQLRLYYALQQASRFNIPHVHAGATLAVRIARQTKSLGTSDNIDEQPTPDQLAFGSVDKRKPRGIVDANLAEYFKQGRSYTPLTGTDVVESADQINQLMNSVISTTADLIDQLIDGDISISPYLLGGNSPCAYCDFKNVCRFEYPVNSYRVLSKDEQSDAPESE